MLISKHDFTTTWDPPQYVFFRHDFHLQIIFAMLPMVCEGGKSMEIVFPLFTKQTSVSVD